MKLPVRSAADFGRAIGALLPPGAAWEWPEGGYGAALLTATGQEPARVQAGVQGVLDRAVEMHRPCLASWTLAAYRAVAAAAVAGVAEVMPRKAAAVGGKIGMRLWSHGAPAETFPVPLVQVDHLVGPARVGSRIGDRLWGHRARYVLRVRYYRSVVRPEGLYQALDAFKQAHVFLWFEDITGAGGHYAPN
jgi:hypothetical protein